MSVPGGPLGRRERSVPGQLELVLPDEDGTDEDGAGADGAGDGVVLLARAMMIILASRFPAVTGPATSTCSPLDRSERLTFRPPWRTAVAGSYCQVQVVPLAALTTRVPLSEVTVPR